MVTSKVRVLVGLVTVASVFTGCSNTPAFSGPVPDSLSLSTLAFRSEPPAELYSVTADGVPLGNFQSQFDITAGVRTIAGKFETREHNCARHPLEVCNGKVFFGDCAGSFVAESGKDYTAVTTAEGRGAVITVIDAETSEKVGGGTCTMKGSSYSRANR